jgi:DNA-binding PucR family transcriptional regulator
MDVPVTRQSGLDALLSELQPVERMRAFCETQLGPLRTYDRVHGADLVRTLDAYFTSGGSPSATARALGTHRNTVLYRLRRIEDLSNARLHDPLVSLQLQLALRIAATLDD